MNVNDTEPTTDILGDIILKEKVVLSFYKKIFIVIIIILLIAFNLYLANKMASNHFKDIADRRREMLGAYLSILFALPVSAFILSLLISFIPYKKMEYYKKYFPFGLIILLCLQILLLIMLLMATI